MEVIFRLENTQLLIIIAIVVTIIRLILIKLNCLTAINEYNQSGIVIKALQKIQRFEILNQILIVCVAAIISVLSFILLINLLIDWTKDLMTAILTISLVMLSFIVYFILSNVTDDLIRHKVNQMIRKTEQSMIESMYYTARESFFFFLPFILYGIGGFTLFIPIEELFGLGDINFLIRFNLRIIVFAFITSNVLRIIKYVAAPYMLSFKLKPKPVESEEGSKLFSEIINKHNIAKARLYEFPSIKEKYANAIATDALTSKIFIADYLFKNININEFKAIIFHEIGHLKYRHIIKQQERELILSLFYALFITIPFLGLNTLAELYFIRVNESIYNLMRIASQVVVGLGIIIFFGYYGVLKTPSISRKQEKEADEFVLKNGIEPQVYISALEKLYSLDDSPVSLGKLEEKLSTHPSLENRIKYINEFAKSMGS